MALISHRRIRPCEKKILFCSLNNNYLDPTTYYFVRTRKIFCSLNILCCSLNILFCSLNILFCSHNILSCSINILFFPDPRWPPAGNIVLTLDHIGNTFKNLLRRNYWVNWNQTQSQQSLVGLLSKVRLTCAGPIHDDCQRGTQFNIGPYGEVHLKIFSVQITGSTRTILGHHGPWMVPFQTYVRRFKK